MAEQEELVFGRHPVEELLHSDKAVSKVFIYNKLSGDFEKNIRKITKEKGVPLVRVAQEYLDKIARNKNHQGILATASPIAFKEIEDIIPHLFENGEVPNILILDHIKDVRNFGAIARSAEVFGVHAMIIPRRNSAAINQDAIKTSAGALLNIDVCRVGNLSHTIDLLKSYGIKVLSSDVNAKTSLQDTSFIEPIAVILGSESKGVQKSLLSISDDAFRIQQQGKTDSLNVAVSAGIILYEIDKQRTNIL